MNEDGNINITADTANKASELRPDIDLNDPKLGLKIAAERLSIVRYVFLVQIDDRSLYFHKRNRNRRKDSREV